MWHDSLWWPHLEISVNDGWVVAMQVHQALQNLPGPTLEHLLINVFVPLAVPGTGTQGQLCQAHCISSVEACRRQLVRGAPTHHGQLPCQTH